MNFNEEKIRKLLSEIEKSEVVISKERDKLREIFEEIEDLIYALDSGLDSLEGGKTLIEDGLDTLSAHL